LDSIPMGQVCTPRYLSGMDNISSRVHFTMQRF
jgi:hypothetical protein